MPALEPEVIQTVRRRCPRGMALGIDDLCYPKAVVGRRNRFRKWKGAPKPAVSAHDLRVAKMAASVKATIIKVGHDLGGTGGKNKVEF